MKLQQNLTETPTAELELRPEVRQRLETVLSVYADLQEQIAELTRQADLERSKLGKLLNDHGYDKVATDTHALTWIRGAKMAARLDKTKLLAQGVTPKQIDAATVPGGTKKDYFQIRAKNTQSSGPIDE